MPIVTISAIGEALGRIAADDVVYVDLDDTVVSTEVDASPRFEAGVKALLEAQGVKGGAAFESSCAVWCALQGVCTAGPVEAGTRAFLEALRSRGVPVIGLTARGPDLADETARHLELAGIDNCFNAESSLGAIADLADGRPPLTHRAGVVFCTGSRKPAAMGAYAAVAGLAGRRCVLIDDLRSHLEAAERALGENFLGFHYVPTRPPYEVPRLADLLATALTAPRGRSFLRRALGALEPPEPDRHHPGSRLTPLAGAFLGGILAGAAGAALALGRQRS